ncbi:Cation-transporting P-type ATPase N-terminal domain-containing protein [Plasmodiophora brassicae]
MWPLLLLLLGACVDGNPFLHTPNAGCPDMALDTLCPPVCVADLSTCPSSVAAVCAAGEIFCPDGRCRALLDNDPHKSCLGVIDPCICASPAMKSCKRVQIPIGQSLASSLSAVHSLCSVTLNASLLQCDDANAATSDVPYYEKQVDDLRGWLEAMSIAIVVYTATFALFMGYNKAQVKQQLPSYGVTQHPSTTLDQEIIAGHHQPRQVGYRDTTIGNVMFAAMITLTLAVTLEILAICLQYYVLIELERQQVEVSFDKLNILFIVTWHILFIWLFVLNVFYPVIRNLFRTEAPMHEAAIVRLSLPNENTVITDGNAIVRFGQDVRKRLHKVLSFGGQTVNCAVQTTQTGQRYIEFHCERYIYSPESGRHAIDVVNNGTRVYLMWSCADGKRIRCQAMARQESDSHVLRGGSWRRVNSTLLVPGDIVSLLDVRVIPFDGVVIDGTCVVDESALTGESVPKPKFPLDRQETSVVYDRSGRGAKHTVFAGTILLQQTANNNAHGAVAVVVDTGARTSKGKLLRSILFPKMVALTFDCELQVVFGILMIWTIIAFLASMALLGATVSSWFYGVFTLGNIILPTLPAFLVVGQSVAARRLRRRGIHCRDLNRIVAAGKVRVFAFDKTGTITCSGLRFEGVRTAESRHFHSVCRSEDFVPVDSQVVTQTMACAHTISFLENGQPVGACVDMEMFAATKWNMEQSAETGRMTIYHGDVAFEVIRTLEFESTLMRMCRVVRMRSTGDVHVFLKGSFEKIKSLSRLDTVPRDFDAVAVGHARTGSYTLALAHRCLGKLTDRQVTDMTREQLEESADLVGLILFQNSVKPDSAQAISLLRDADIRPVMLTGDNAFTACHTALQVGMIVSNSRIIYGDVADDSNAVKWTDIITNRPVDHSDVLRCIQNHDDLFSPCELALSGRAFRTLLDNNTIRQYLFHTRVFARCKPEDKTDMVRLFQEKVVVAMCGDGGNDCGALQTAHAGIALSEGDASIASPFSATTDSIMSCVDLVSFGRSALSINLSLYKFAVLYGETMLFAEFFAYYFTVILPILVWAYLDGPVLIGMAWAISQALPAADMAPRRPTARVLGLETVSAVVGTIGINIVFMIGGLAWLYNQDFMHCRQFNAEGIDTFEWWKLQDNYEASFISIVSMFQCLWVAFIMTLGGEYRQRWYRNRTVLVVGAALFAFLAAVVLLDPNVVGCAMRLNCGNAAELTSSGYDLPAYIWGTFYSPVGTNVFPLAFRASLMLFVVFNGAVLAFFHSSIIYGPIRRRLRILYPNRNRFKVFT